MKVLTKILVCFVLLTVGRLSAQETFAPLISDDCVVFAHVDFSKVEIGKVKDAVQKTGEDVLRRLGFDEGSFKSTARELRTELEKWDIIVRPAFDTVTKDLGIREVAIIADMGLIEREIVAVIVVPWKDKTDRQLETLRNLLHWEDTLLNDFMQVGDFLILPMPAYPWMDGIEEAVENWAAEVEPSPKAPIFDALKSVADDEIKLAVAIPERIRLMARAGGMPPEIPNEVKGLILFATQKVQWASASLSLSELLGGPPSKNADVLLTLKMTKRSDAVQLRGMMEQLIEYGTSAARFAMEQDQSMEFQPPPLFFYFIKGILRTLLPDVEDDTLKFRLKGNLAMSKQTAIGVAAMGSFVLLPTLVQAAQETTKPAHVGLRGKAVFSDDGSPVPMGTVCFETDTYLARGDLKTDGTFVVGSLRQNDGLPAGRYRVYISGAQKSVGKNDNGMEIYESLIDERFASGSTSGITIDVTPKTKNLEVRVDRYDPTKRRK